VDLTYRFSGFSVDAVRRLLLGPDGRPIALKPRVFDTLLYLIEHRGELLEKQTLLDAIWPNVVVEENNLNQAVSTLRRIFGESRDDHRFIVTEPGRGYRFVARVETVTAEAPAPAHALTAAGTLVPVMEREPDGSKRPPLPSGVEAPVRVAPSPGRPTTAPRWVWAAAAAIAVVAVALVVAVIFRPRPAPVAAGEALRFDVARGTGPAGDFVAISPDGRRIAFGNTRQDGAHEIWVRSLETQEAWLLVAAFAAGLGFERPFWSADSRYIIFSSQGKIRRVDASGGPTQPLGDVQTGVFGGFTTKDGRLVYAEQGGGAWETSFSGGTPRWLDLGPDAAAAQTPSALPDGSLVYCQCVESAEFGIYLATPGAGPPRRLLPDRSSVQYAPSPDPELGYLLFVRGSGAVGAEGTLMAQAIHPRERRLIGDPVAIAENVLGFSASDTGVLVYSSGGSTFFPRMPGFVQGQLTWFDREGRVVSTVGESGIYRELALSPDQQHVALTRADPVTRGIHIHLLELARGVSNRFTFAAVGHTSPVWAPDGASVIFARWSPGKPVEWYRRATNLVGDEELVFQALDTGVPTAISPDGRFTLFYGPPAGPSDIKAVDLTRVPEAREPISLVSSEFNEVGARFSPDGRWFAYGSNESGTWEIYVRPFYLDAVPGAASAAGRVIVSQGAASPAIWRADGRELFYVSDDTLMAVAVTTEPTFSVAGAPQALFKLPGIVGNFAVSRDGERFLLAVPDGARAPPPAYRVIVNWTSTLR
jgi:DNA-binding winged helix-turn-helix (wHTH) protein/Tol biopolymer transport system component